VTPALGHQTRDGFDGLCTRDFIKPLGLITAAGPAAAGPAVAGPAAVAAAAKEEREEEEVSRNHLPHLVTMATLPEA